MQKGTNIKSLGGQSEGQSPRKLTYRNHFTQASSPSSPSPRGTFSPPKETVPVRLLSPTAAALSNSSLSLPAHSGPNKGFPIH